MARNDHVDRTNVRNRTMTLSEVKKAQMHNEREKDSYINPDIILERSPMNVYYKRPTGDYEEMFNELKKSGVISTRGLKEDAKMYGELVFDVNSAYFYNHGGYEFAKKYFEESYKAAIKIVGGEQYILSAEMHADERNRAMSEELGFDVFHYHMHVVYIPVVKKDILWSKRCKDKSLVGTVKETVMQVSSSKKWESKPALDESGKPLLNDNGKPILRMSYSVLQDDYYNHMYSAGYTDVERGERGSTEEHLSVTQFKVKREMERLKELQEKQKQVAQAIEKYENEAVDIMVIAENTQKKLDELAPVLKDTEKLANELDTSPEFVLPEAGSLETGKNYREKKAKPLIDKFIKILNSLNRKYHELKNDLFDLRDDYEYEVRKNRQLLKDKERLSEENSKLRVMAKNFNRVMKYFGKAQIDKAIEVMKQKEIAEERNDIDPFELSR